MQAGPATCGGPAHAMGALEELERLALPGPSLVSVGVFDGVHRGHQRLLRELVARARERGAVSVVLTFRNHPRTVLQGGSPVPLLAGLEERFARIRDLGVDRVVALPFDAGLAQLTAREFVLLLRRRLGMVGMVMGPTFRLGRGAEGTPQVLQDLGRELGFAVIVVEPLALEDCTPINSTAIRDALARGGVERAAEMLGRPYTLPGVVVRGEGRGRGLGFPTANLEPDPGRAVPGDGIYATWAEVEGRRYPSATSIGLRPTFGGQRRTVEAYLMDFEGDLYGRRMALTFVARLREERRFPSVSALVEQMARDVEDARRRLGVPQPASVEEPDGSHPR